MLTTTIEKKIPYEILTEKKPKIKICEYTGVESSALTKENRNGVERLT